MFSDFREKSYWLQSRSYTPSAPLRTDETVDVAVVGGGFTGLTAAYFLKKAEPSLSVALAEAQVVGFGASGRNGGFNMTLFGLTLGVTAARFGRAKTREAHHYMEKAVDNLRDRVAELSLDCDYEHPGFLRVATSASYEKRIRHEIELAHQLGLSGITWMDRDRLAQEVQSPLYRGAWWEPRCGIVNPAKLAWAWKEQIVKQGVSVYENSPVGSIQKSPAGVVLRTPNGTLRAKKILLATNAYSHLLPVSPSRQIPVWTYIVLSEPLSPERMAAIGWRNRQGIEDARNLVHYYRLTVDNRLLMGGRDINFAHGRDMEKDSDEKVFEGLRRDVVETFPQLAGVRFTHSWGGPVSVTLDMAPAMGYAGDKSVVYSLGCMGHGVSLANLNGRTAADLLLERKTELTDVFFVNRRTLPWPPEPLRTMAANAILTGMRVADRFTDKR